MNWSAPITLQGEHIKLVPLTAEHCGALMDAVKDGELWKLWYTIVPSPEKMSQEIQRRLDMQTKGVMLPFVIVANVTQQVVGMTTYCNIDANIKRLEIGWTWYSKSVQRTALNTECKLLLLTHAFEVLQCIAVEFRTNFYNFTSRKAIERMGAKQDGILRNHRITPNGIVGDTCVYSIINSEWPAAKINLISKLEFHKE